MTHIFQTLRDNPGARRVSKRVGRGIGSGKGKTAGKGVKGQKARAGISIKGFEGGQMPVHRRLPKRGFNNHTRKDFEVINTGIIQTFVDSGKLDSKKSINREELLKAGLVKGNLDGIKLLAKGEIKAKVTIEVCKASASAISAIEKAGGKVVLLAKAPRAEAPKKSKKAE